MTDVTDCGQFQEHGRIPTYSEHANTGLPKTVHLHYTQGAAVQTLLQGANLVHHFSQQLQMSSNVSFGGCGSVCAHAAIKSFLPPFYQSLISFTRPSSRLFFSGKGSTARGRPGYEAICFPHQLCQIDHKKPKPVGL